MVVMKTVYSMTCPHCGATIDVDADVETTYCNYCGNKIYIDDNAKKINKNINYHKTYTDEAKIKETESKERIKIKKMEYKERQERREDKNDLIYMIVGFAILFIMCAVVWITEQPAKPKEDEVKVPFSAEELEGKNYEVVISDLENAGFTNVKEKQIKDIVVGLVKKDGEVEQVSVNGDSDFTSGTIFPDDAKVVVVYHTPKK